MQDKEPTRELNKPTPRGLRAAAPYALCVLMSTLNQSPLLTDLSDPTAIDNSTGQPMMYAAALCPGAFDQLPVYSQELGSLKVPRFTLSQLAPSQPA